MRKFFTILLILALFSALGWGQYQTTNLDFLYNGEIEVIGSDTLLVDSITGVGDSRYKLTFVDFDINNKYLTGKTAAKLNEQPIITFFQNANYADTAFCKWEEHALNVDTTEALPFRITYLAHYSTTTVDANNFFETPRKGVGLDVGVGKTYTTIDAAYSAASNGDTLNIFDGDFTVQTASTYFWIQKQVFFNGVGFSIVRGVSGTRTILFVGSGTKRISRLVIDGSNSTGSVIQTFANSIDNFVDKCYVYNAPISTTEPIYEYQNSSVIFNRCSFNNNNTNHTLRFDGYNNKLYECYFGGNLQKDVFSTFSDTSISFYYCDFKLNKGSVLDPVTMRSGLYEWKFNNFKILNKNTRIFHPKSGVSPIKINLSKNTFQSDGKVDEEILAISGGVSALSITNNIFSFKDSSQIKDIIQVVGLESDVSINNNFFETTSTTSLKNIAISTVAKNFGHVDINYNTFHSNTKIGYVIRIGTEATSGGDYLIDGGNIIGNKILGAIHFNDTLTNVATHAIMIGYNKNWTVKYNYVEGCGISYLCKSNSGVNTTGGFFYNVSKNPYLYSFYSKGHESVLFYNNTSINELNNIVQHFYLSENLGGDSPDNCKIENNVVYDSYNSINNVGVYVNSATVTGLNINYNDFYTKGGNYGRDIAGVHGFGAWQALGYDADSYNSNPNLSANYYPIPPSDAIGNGVDLGSEFKLGLDISSIWTDSLKYDNQGLKWTIGAFIVKNKTLLRNSKAVVNYKGTLLYFDY